MKQFSVFMTGLVVGACVVGMGALSSYAKLQHQYNELLASWVEINESNDNQIRLAYLEGARQVRELKEAQDAVHRSDRQSKD